MLMKNTLALISITFLVFLSAKGFTQEVNSHQHVDKLDTLYGQVLHDVEIVADGDEYRKKYARAKYFVRRMYPYAMLASQMLLEYQDTLNTITKEHKKKKFLKKANKELKEEFGDEIRDLSVTRGKYLVKLIYRETGISVYNIIKQYRGGMKAVFWQGLCIVNGQDLKETFDPEEDIIIERVVQEIESGELRVIPRSPKSEKGKEVEKRRKKKKKKNKKSSDKHVVAHS